MESRYVVAVIAFVIYHTSLVEGYGTGAPSPACLTLTPGHWENGKPISPQDPASSSYALAVDKQSVMRGGMVQVSIKGAVFKGFLLQARLADGSSTDPVGTFSNAAPADTRTTQCTSADDSATHANPNDKAAGTTFTWMAPYMEFGDIKFMATVAENHDLFWVGHESEVVTYDPGPCDDGWALVGKENPKCYRSFDSTPAGETEQLKRTCCDRDYSRMICEWFGGTLAMPKTMEQQYDLVQYLTSIGATDQWIGLWSPTPGGQLFYSDRTILPESMQGMRAGTQEPWSFEDPWSESGRNEPVHCVRMEQTEGREFKWSDQDCDWKYGFLCEKEPTTIMGSCVNEN